jgi:6-phosphofructokinase 1
MTERIAILTGGGDCPGLNAAIRAVVKHADLRYGWQVTGIEDGFAGAVERRFVELSRKSVINLLSRGGTLLGSSNHANPFAYPTRAGESQDVSEQVLANLTELGLSGLVVVGGDGTMAIGRRLMEASGGALPLVGIPKTIDNDLAATEATIGFQTAVEVATEAIDRLHTTAESHDRIMICEVMGRYAGWIALSAGLASGADVILIPEIPYDIERVIQSLHRRHQSGCTYSIIVVAEGARPQGGDFAVSDSGDATREKRLGGAAEHLAGGIKQWTDYDVRVTVLGHIQRGGAPCAFDRNLATRFGVFAVDLIAARKFGQVAALRCNEIVAVPIEAATQNTRLVEPTDDLVKAARATGVELG